MVAEKKEEKEMEEVETEYVGAEEQALVGEGAVVLDGLAN